MCQAWACWQVTFSLQHYCYYYSKKYAAIENRGVFFICLRLSKKAYSTPPPTHFNVCVCMCGERASVGSSWMWMLTSVFVWPLLINEKVEQSLGARWSHSVPLEASANGDPLLGRRSGSRGVQLGIKNVILSTLPRRGWKLQSGV